MLRRSLRGGCHMGLFFKTNPYDGGCKNRKTSFSCWNRGLSMPGGMGIQNLFLRNKAI